MSELNNFRVVLNLSNFFNDHRHRARVFINKNIHTIQELQDRVSHIFRINNFHLTAQNEYLPPSEDIRLLQNNEVIWAMPSNPNQTVEQSQLAVETNDHSEPRTKLNSSGTKPKKRKKSPPVVEEITIEDPDAEPLEKEKKKKNKKKRRSVEEDIGINTSNVTLMDATEESEPVSKSDIHEKTSTTISFGGSSGTAPLSYKKNKVVPLITDQYLKQKKVNIVKIDFISGSVASLKELKLKETQKPEKEFVDVEPETEQMQCDIPAESVEEQPVEDEKNVEPETSSHSRENTLTSEGNLKVDVGKSKVDVGKSKVDVGNSKVDVGNSKVDVGNSKVDVGILKQIGCDKVSAHVSMGNLKKQPPKILPKPKFFKTPNWRKQAGSLNASTFFEEIPVLPIITDTASIDSENLDKPVLEEKTEDAAEEIPATETPSAVQNVQPEPEQSPKILETTKPLPASSSSIEMSFVAEEDTLQTSLEEISGIYLNGSEAVPSEMGKTENGSIEISGVHRIHSGGGLKPFKKISGVGTFLEGLRASTSTTSLDTTSEIESSEFVTRRVRKRNRKRQKKSHDSTDYTDKVTETYQPRPMNVKGSPAIHIKFSEDEQVFDATGGPVEAEGSNCVNLSGSQTILIESENDEVRVKDKDIFNSPLMTHLLPKAGDVIAFKVLKLSDDYMPEMSTHIIAKVLSFNGSNKCVHLEILGGLDQCHDPEGKFSMDLDSHEKKSRNRVYLWTDLIEPRLMFP